MSSTDRAVDTPAPLGRRERKKTATRDRILACAVDLFASRGYDSTTMDDISECADVARATVFNHFARKEDIIFEWFVRRRTELATILTEAEQHTTDTPSRLRHAFRAFAYFYENDSAAVRAMIRAWIRAGGPLLAPASETPALLANTIRTGQEQGDFPPDVDATRAAIIIFDAYMGVLYRWVADEHGQFAFEENLLVTLDLILTGITQEHPVEQGQTQVAKKPTQH